MLYRMQQITKIINIHNKAPDICHAKYYTEADTVLSHPKARDTEVNGLKLDMNNISYRSCLDNDQCSGMNLDSNILAEDD